MEVAVVYITARDRDQALQIGRKLVEERLAACVNVVPQVSSLYWWEDRVEESDEAALIAKTRQDLVGSVVQRVQELHTYECPCVVSWTLDAGSEAFLDWVCRETG